MAPWLWTSRCCSKSDEDQAVVLWCVCSAGHAGSQTTLSVCNLTSAETHTPFDHTHALVTAAYDVSAGSLLGADLKRAWVDAREWGLNQNEWCHFREQINARSQFFGCASTKRDFVYSLVLINSSLNLGFSTIYGNLCGKRENWQKKLKNWWHNAGAIYLPML